MGRGCLPPLFSAFWEARLSNATKYGGLVALRTYFWENSEEHI